MILQYKRPYHYEKQEQAIFNNKRFLAIEASTKSGKTHGCINRIIEEALQARDHDNLWWVAPTYKQAKIAFRRMKRGLRAMKEFITINETELFISITGAGTIWFLSGEQPDNLYGEDVVFCIIDEASRLREEAFFAVFSTLTATEGKLVLIGNVTDRWNWFYVLCRKFEANTDEDWGYSMLTIWDAVEGGIVKLKTAHTAKKTLPDSIFKALYECNPDDEGLNPFGLDNIQRCTISEMPKTDPILMAWDLGRKIDHTVGTGIDVEGFVCKSIAFKKDWDITTEIITQNLFNVTNYIDATGVGDPIVQSISKGRDNVVPFIITRHNRQLLLEHLAILMVNDLIKFPKVYADQLMKFEICLSPSGKIQWKVPTGCHDDFALSLAIACFHLSVDSYSWNMESDLNEYIN